MASWRGCCCGRGRIIQSRAFLLENRDPVTNAFSCGTHFDDFFFKIIYTNTNKNVKSFFGGLIQLFNTQFGTQQLLFCFSCRLWQAVFFQILNKFRETRLDFTKYFYEFLKNLFLAAGQQNGHLVQCGGWAPTAVC